MSSYYYEDYEPYNFHIYPVTIIEDRYRGCYSEARWTAWNEYEETVPEGPSMGDPECMNFWDKEAKDWLVGKGATPQEAYEDLVAKAKERLARDEVLDK